MSSPDYNYSIFKHIQTTNGADVMKLAREYERKTVALVRYQHHMTFNHLLKSSDLLPPSLIFTPPVRTKIGYKIARKTEIKYLRIQHAQRFNLKVFKSRVTSSSFFSTDEGLRVSRNVLPQYTSQWQKNNTIINYVISWLQLLHF